ncbi:MAG: peroxiredoxin family protein [Pyrinomonadaceae bacterium]
MSKLKQHIEFLANVAIIVVAVALCAVLVKQYFFAGPPPPAQQRPAVGAKIALPGVDLAAQDKTLLLVLQKGCHYCSESAPFYQRLAREAADKAGQVKVVAVLPQAVDEGRSYVSELGVPALEVRQAQLGALSVGGTPTIIMVNRGTVTDVWVGKLDAAGESQVLNKL